MTSTSGPSTSGIPRHVFGISHMHSSIAIVRSGARIADTLRAAVTASRI